MNIHSIQFCGLDDVIVYSQRFPLQGMVPRPSSLAYGSPMTHACWLVFGVWRTSGRRQAITFAMQLGY